MSKRNALLAGVAAAAALAAVVAVVLLKRPQPAARSLDPLELLPSACEAAFVVPEVGRLGERLAMLPKLQLAQLSATLAGYPDAEAFLKDLERQAGFDFRSRDSLRAAGIDPDKALVAAALPDGTPVAALPASDLARLQALLAKHAADKLGATQREERRAGQHTLTTFVSPKGGDPALAMGHKGNYLLMSTGPKAIAAVQGSLDLAPEASLAKSASFAAVQARYAKGTEVYGWASPGSASAKSLNLPQGVALGLSISNTLLKAGLDVPLDDAKAQELASLQKPAGGDLVAKLDPGAFAVFRYGGDPAWLKPFAAAMTPRMFQSALRAAGVDVSEEVLGNLKPGLAMAFSLAQTAKMGSVPQLDPRRTNPFDFVFMEVVGRPKDPERAKATFAKIAEVAPRFGANMTEREAAGTKVHVTNYHLGEGASFAIKDEYALVTGGPGQMEASIARLGGGAGPKIEDASARASLEKDAAVFYLDVSRLVASLRALPDSAYGVGGFAIRAAFMRWLDAVAEITALRASSSLAGKELHLELVLSLQQAPSTAQKEP